MPIFEYKCDKCSSVFEVFVKSRKEEKDTACINCGSKKVNKLFSSFYSRIKKSSGEHDCSSCPVKNCPKKHNL